MNMLPCLIFLNLFPAELTELDAQRLLTQGNELQAKCLDYRKKTTLHGHVFLHIVEEIDQTPGSTANKRKEAEHRIWFSEERLRFDIRGRAEDGQWRDWTHYAINHDHYIWIPEGSLEGVSAPIKEFASQKGGAIGHFTLYHPRWLGMGQNSESTMQVNPYARFITSDITKPIYTEINKEIFNGWDSWRIVRKTSFPPATPGGDHIPGEFIIWIAPEAGYSLIRAELREHDPRRTMVRSVENQIEQFPDSGIWFPRKIIREIKYGDRLARRRVITIQEAQFGHPPNDAVFTLQGMNLAKGKRVSDRTAGQRPTELISDGTGVLQVQGPRVETFAVDQDRHGRTWLLILNAIILACLSILLFTIYMFKSRRNRK